LTESYIDDLLWQCSTFGVGRLTSSSESTRSRHDREARLKVILNQQSEMTVLRQRIDEIEADREARLKVIHDQLEQSAGSIKELKSKIAHLQTVRGAVHALLRRSTLH
jgi:predicted  nucleic acid-binding Zn-ribbon protein